MRLKRIYGTGDKRASERNTALIRIQLEAQERNRQWYDFLCTRRDELSARLGQQGYSPDPPEKSYRPATSRPDTSMQDALDAGELSSTDTSRWGTPPNENANLQEATSEVPATLERSDSSSSPIWWNEHDGSHI